MIDAASGNAVFVLIDKEKHKEELSAVQAHWAATGGSGTLIAVHRVQNEKQYRRFRAAGAALQQANSHAQLSMIVYHGTRGNPPWLTCESNDGFDASKGKVAPG